MCHNSICMAWRSFTELNLTLFSIQWRKNKIFAWAWWNYVLGMELRTFNLVAFVTKKNLILHPAFHMTLQQYRPDFFGAWTRFYFMNFKCFLLQDRNQPKECSTNCSSSSILFITNRIELQHTIIQSALVSLAHSLTQKLTRMHDKSLTRMAKSIVFCLFAAMLNCKKWIFSKQKNAFLSLLTTGKNYDTNRSRGGKETAAFAEIWLIIVVAFAGCWSASWNAFEMKNSARLNCNFFTAL